MEELQSIAGRKSKNRFAREEQILHKELFKSKSPKGGKDKSDTEDSSPNV